MQELDGASRYLLLSRNRAELRERLARIRFEQQHGEAPLDAALFGQGQRSKNDAALSCLQSSLESELEQTVRALSRLDIGHGDLCSRCGRPIEATQFSALPYATRCAPCATRLSAAVA